MTLPNHTQNPDPAPITCTATSEALRTGEARGLGERVKEEDRGGRQRMLTSRAERHSSGGDSPARVPEPEAPANKGRDVHVLLPVFLLSMSSS